MAITPFPLSAKIDIATAITHEIIPAPGADIRLEIGFLFMKSSGTNTVIIKDGATARTGAISEAAQSGEVLPMGSAPLLLSANSAFNLTLSAAQQVSGLVNYRKVSV